MTSGEGKSAKYKYFTSITAHMGEILSKSKNSLFQKEMFHAFFLWHLIFANSLELNVYFIM
jgi:hypothetical protein